MGRKETVTRARPDVPLAHAIVAISPERGAVEVLQAPDVERRRDAFSYIFGACDPYWQDCEHNALCGELMVQIWHAVLVLGIPAPTLHAALLVIPDYRELMPPETVTAWQAPGG